MFYDPFCKPRHVVVEVKEHDTERKVGVIQDGVGWGGVGDGVVFLLLL